MSVGRTQARAVARPEAEFLNQENINTTRAGPGQACENLSMQCSQLWTQPGPHCPEMEVCCGVVVVR
eukprot:2735247-Amphidinium_carterae.1